LTKTHLKKDIFSRKRDLGSIEVLFLSANDPRKDGNCKLERTRGQDV